LPLQTTLSLHSIGYFYKNIIRYGFFAHPINSFLSKSLMKKIFIKKIDRLLTKWYAINVFNLVNIMDFKMLGVISMITITVCIGSSCHLKCSYDIVSGLENLIKEKDLADKIIVKASFCLGHCTKPVCVKVNDGPVISVSKDNIDSFFEEHVMKNL